MKNRLTSLLSRASVLLHHSKVIPQARYLKLVNELKQKLKENT